MKVKVTKKQIKENYRKVLCVGYCELCYLLKCKEPRYCTSGVYGWNADIYDIYYKGENVAIVTGYRPFGKRIDYDLAKEYNKKAEKLYEELYLKIDFEEMSEKLEELIEEFMKEVIENE